MSAPNEPDWPVLEVRPDLVLAVTREMPALPPAIDAEVERVWQQARRARPLFNGRVFCADTVAPDRIVGHWTEYRRQIAHMSVPALRPALGIRSLAVCGVVRCDEGVVLGRRHPASVYQAGEWQLPPAGSVDSGAACPGGASWRRAVLAELREELGVDPACVAGLRPLCLVQHPSGVLDIGIEIQVRMSAAAVLAAHARCGDHEYDRVLVLPPDRVAGWVDAQAACLVPSAAAFLARVTDTYT